MKSSTKHKASAFFNLFPDTSRVDPSGKKCPPGFHPAPKKKKKVQLAWKPPKADLTPRQWYLQHHAALQRARIHRPLHYKCPRCKPIQLLPKVGWCTTHRCWAIPNVKGPAHAKPKG